MEQQSAQRMQQNVFMKPNNALSHQSKDANKAFCADKTNSQSDLRLRSHELN